MTQFFDKQQWCDTLRHPDWYITLVPQFVAITKQAHDSDKATYEAIKESVYQFFQDRLANQEIALGSEGPDWDAERQPIDKVIIHHTSNPPGISRERLNAMQLVKLYAPYYANPSEAERRIRGQAIFSHHFWQGQQVFYAYHWLIRSDGKAERLLADNETGWQSGNWEVNCRSVAICIDDDLEDGPPSATVLDSIAKLIATYYPQIARQDVFGHREINPKTTCPSNKFLGEDGWKQQLLARLIAQ